MDIAQREPKETEQMCDVCLDILDGKPVTDEEKKETQSQLGDCLWASNSVIGPLLKGATASAVAYAAGADPSTAYLTGLGTSAVSVGINIFIRWLSKSGLMTVLSWLQKLGFNPRARMRTIKSKLRGDKQPTADTTTAEPAVPNKRTVNANFNLIQNSLEGLTQQQLQSLQQKIQKLLGSGTEPAATPEPSAVQENIDRILALSGIDTHRTI